MNPLRHATFANETMSDAPAVVAHTVCSAEEDKGRQYYLRAGTFGPGSVIVGPHTLTPQEQAIANVFYPQQQYVNLEGNAPSPQLIAAVQRNNIKRLVGYDQTSELQSLANELGIQVLENSKAYKTLDQYGLVKSIEMHRDNNPNSSLQAFGRTYENFSEMDSLAQELMNTGQGVVIKVDEVEGGGKTSSGIGVFIIKTPKEYTEKINQIKQLTKGAKVKGVVQMYIPGHEVYSITSEKNAQTGTYDILEAHQQQQKNGIVADGAIPFSNTNIRDLLLLNIWPELQDVYSHVGVTGGQNMNFLGVPETIRPILKDIYGGRSADEWAILPMDPNVRPQSGTKMAMQGYITQAKRPIDLASIDGYRYGSVSGHPAVIANPMALYKAAVMMGLKIGEDGEFAVVNYGGTTDAKLASQMKNQQDSTVKIFIANTENAKNKFEQFRQLITNNWQKVLESCAITTPSKAISDTINQTHDSQTLSQNLADFLEK